jgi:hypothetical protein
VFADGESIAAKGGGPAQAAVRGGWPDPDEVVTTTAGAKNRVSLRARRWRARNDVERS